MAIPGLGAADEILSIKTKEGDFLVIGMTGHEHLGQMFAYTAELAGSLDLLGKRGEKRGRYETYTLTLQPWLWSTTRVKNSRVFQDKSVKDIVTAVLGDY